ncbi:MAG: glutamate--tRNA ligase [Runella slithyformis]|nr:MAG: glutamate--tRNA ligase [Runella slithyformis]TAE98601.1 MAG: glutamate--tRNA ligase [Runella slithyformis]TAF24408.1 MAG: glutamate--tRNA ligase [Runella slithyformis]TAF49379.1 MAG: glutamate--tRNA ligase [Runella slithyformis]TAF79197.1 MAG: glutamate--tRNA ligase [Runella slithyformis]
MVRVRFAPSPTGPLHIGGVRTALYNYLFARKHGGTMLLRIEDTDQNRYVLGAENYILESLQWLGIEIDEGQSVGGPHAPYRQSERKEMYRQYAEQLIADGKAYYAFDTADEIEAMRQRLEAAGADAAQYNAITRLQMNNSLTISATETQQRLANGTPYVIRIKIDPKEEIRFKDIVRDWVVVHASTLDDKVLLKSDGMPTYHLANIVDDHLMEISHVIRGEEWLPSAPLHVLMYQYFGWNAPQFAHLPLLLKPEGNGKLSKRDADLGGFPIFPLLWQDPATGAVARSFREDGYLPEATINFLAFLGWNPGTEQELFSMSELIEAFSLERIHKAGARFDIQKAKWFNQQYLKAKTDEELALSLTGPPVRSWVLNKHTDNPKPMTHDSRLTTHDLPKICRLMKDRVTFPQEILSDAPFLFEAPTAYEEAVVTSKWNADATKTIGAYAADLEIYEGDFLAESVKAIFTATTERLGIKTGKVLQALRLAVTGAGHGPDLMLTMEILGKNEVISRLKKALESLPVA